MVGLIAGGNVNVNPGNLNNNSESSEQAMTSDESQEAMRLFAASPPEGMFQHGGHQVQVVL